MVCDTRSTPFVVCMSWNISETVCDSRSTLWILGVIFFYEFVFQNVVISQSNWWPHIYTCKLTICMIPFHDLQVQPCDNRARVALSGTSLRKQNWAIYTDRCWLSTYLSTSFTQDRSPTIYLDICTEDYSRVDTIKYADLWTIWNLLPQIIYW